MIDPTEAWKLTPTPAGLRAFPDSPPVLWVVKYADGSGNLLRSDGFAFYAPGTPFEHEPSSHLDPTWSTVESVDPSAAPSPPLKGSPMNAAPHPSYAHLLSPSLHESHPDALIGGPNSWVDTSAVFSPSVLSLHPDVPPCPGAVAYGVGYGTLTAFLSAEGVDQHAVLVELGYEDYQGFPEGPYASFEGGVWRMPKS